MNKIDKPKILVTKPVLPDLAVYSLYLERIWNAVWLTNDGPLAKELEGKLRDYFGVRHVFLVSNGTMGLQLAIRALAIRGEIITTPFSFVATADAIVWEHCNPIFVDIDPETLCIDPKKIEVAITKNTKAIMGVHVYGNPCDTEAICRIANKHQLKIIYDAAHAFGTRKKGRSILTEGDVSVLSFHATKLFHTGEGGAIVTNDDEVAKRIIELRNFGHANGEIVSLGINAKNSELHAAMGLALFPKIDEIYSNRKAIADIYKKHLGDLKAMKNFLFDKEIVHGFSYYPIIFESEDVLVKIQEAMEGENIFPRRYFFPSLNTLPFFGGDQCPISESLSRRVLCLPMYSDLALEDAERITRIVRSAVSEKTNEKKISVTVGIPAHNEEVNIIFLLESIIRQKTENFVLEKIIVMCDGCTDNTYQIVQEYSKNYPIVQAIKDGKQLGKTTRLNQLYAINQSDFILTLDGDVILSQPNDIEEMVRCAENRGISVVAGNQEPIEPNGFIPRILYTNHLLWDKVRIPINGGDHIANLYGAVSLIRGSFAKKIQYPTTITCDEEYLYISAKKNDSFCYAKNTRILYRAAETIRDFRLQAARSFVERHSLVSYFGPSILRLHHIPIQYKILGILQMLRKSPIYTSLAILLNFWMRLFPTVDALNTSGMWQIARSTKRSINIV